MKRYIVNDLQGCNFMDYSHPIGLTATEIRQIRWDDYKDNFMADANEYNDYLTWNQFTMDFIADFWELEFEEIKITTADEATQYAIDWQNWQSEQSLSIGELSEWQGYFETLAEKFNLTDEFKENAII